MALFKDQTFKYYFVTVLVSTLILFRPISDPDFGWHYKYGQYFVQNHVIKLDANTFSYNLADYHWANSYWLAEVFFYVVYSIHPALPSITTSFALAIVMYLQLRDKKYNVVGGILAISLVTLISTLVSISVRPMIFSNIFLLILINVLTYHIKYLKSLPILFLVWANTHADFVLGLGIYGLYTALHIFMEVKSGLEMRKYKEMMLQIFYKSFWGITSVVVTILNPYGLNLFSTLFNETQSSQFKHISEWMPVLHNYNLNKPLELITIIFAYSIIITAVVGQRKKVDAWLLISIIVSMALSFKSIYFARIAIVLAIYPVALFWGTVATKIPKYIHIENKKILKVFSLYMYTILFLATTGLSLRTLSTYVSKEAFCKFTRYPCGAVNYIKTTKPQGNMFNNYNWGGYLIMNLPEYKTFIDGRMPSWKYSNTYIYDDYINITKYPEESRELFNTYAQEHNITWIFDYKESKLAKYLIETGNWESVYKDDVAIVAIKK